MNPKLVALVAAVLAANNALLQALVEGSVETVKPVTGKTTKTAAVASAPAEDLLGMPAGEDLLGTTAAAETPAAAPAAVAPVVKKGPNLDALAKARAAAKAKRDAATAAAATAAPAAVAPAPAPAAAAPAPVKAAPKKAAAAAAAAPVAGEATAESIKAVGTALLKKDPKGGSAKIQEVLKAAGAANLSALSEDKYAEVQTALQALVG